MKNDSIIHSILPFFFSLDLDLDIELEYSSLYLFYVITSCTSRMVKRIHMCLVIMIIISIRSRCNRTPEIEIITWDVKTYFQWDIQGLSLGRAGHVHISEMAAQERIVGRKDPSIAKLYN